MCPKGTNSLIFRSNLVISVYKENLKTLNRCYHFLLGEGAYIENVCDSLSLTGINN